MLTFVIPSHSGQWWRCIDYRMARALMFSTFGQSLSFRNTVHWSTRTNGQSKQGASGLISWFMVESCRVIGINSLVIEDSREEYARRLKRCEYRDDNQKYSFPKVWKFGAGTSNLTRARRTDGSDGEDRLYETTQMLQSKSPTDEGCTVYLAVPHKRRATLLVFRAHVPYCMHTLCASGPGLLLTAYARTTGWEVRQSAP
ncbi:hypothetical protein V8E53_003175 [Lactarius tabidus]